MNPHDAFLQEILARPDDDVPRLIYADWLEEQGDVRCELIRVQCAVWGMEEHHPEFRRLRQRELALLRRYKNDWLGPITAMIFDAKFHRGFVREVTAGPRQFLRNQEALFRLAPIQRVNLSGLSEDAAREMAAQENLRRITELRLAGGGVNGQMTDSLFTSPHWTQLRCLTWRGDMNPSVRTALAAALEHLPLESFALDGVYLGGPGARLFESIGPNPSLRRLDLSSAGIGAEGAHYLASTRWLVDLRELILAHNRIGDYGLHLLAESSKIQQLDAIDLTDNALHAHGLQQLLAKLHTPRITKLCLAQNPPPPEAVSLVAAAPALARLEHLNLNYVVTVDGLSLRRILETFSLITLRLYGCRIGDEAVMELAKSPGAEKLRLLDLNDNRLTDAAADALLASPYLDRLTRLDLRNNRVAHDRQRSLRRRFGAGVCTFTR